MVSAEVLVEHMNRYLQTLLVVFPLALGLGGPTLLSACSSSAAGLDNGSSFPGADSGQSTPGVGGGGGSINDPSVTGIIAVHASRNLPAFRLCFPENVGVLPLPDDKLMPNSNVVGVDVGAAVHLGTLRTTGAGDNAQVAIDGGPYDAGSTAVDGGASDAGAMDAGSTKKDAGTVDAGTPSSDVVYVIEEKLARQFYPQGTDSGAWPNCGPLVQVLTTNGYEGHGFYTVQSATALGATVLGDNSTDPDGVNLIVIEGCLPDATLDTKACGDTFTPTLGNLRYRIVPHLTTLLPSAVVSGKFPVQTMLLSPRVQASIAAMETVTFSFGDLSNGNAGSFALPALTYGAPVPSPNPQELDFMAGPTKDYDNYGFTLHYGASATLSQSLTVIQSQSSPHDLPQSFYLLPSNFVVLIVGDPNAPKAASGPGASLHFLAVPVRDPSTLVDAGTDGGM